MTGTSLSPDRPGSVPTVVHVRCTGRSYPVLIGHDILDGLAALLKEHAPAARYALIADENVANLYASDVTQALQASGLLVTRHTFSAGEPSKNRDEWARLSDELTDAGVGRDGVVIALGGGVTGDLAGFVAATFMRGIGVVQVPTSLVAMVDASVGGKTGVDTPAGKNLVGAFHPPQFVAIDPGVARTLPRRQRAEGLVEAVKHGAIVDRDYLDQIEGLLPEALDGDAEAIRTVVTGSVMIKARIVSEDENEAGLRQVLNFGHTIGHGLEAASDFELSHGVAVGLGMILEARLGERLGVTKSGTESRLTNVLRRLGVPLELPDRLDKDRILRFISRDKKARDGVPRYVLLEQIGATFHSIDWAQQVSESDVRAVLF